MSARVLGTHLASSFRRSPASVPFPPVYAMSNYIVVVGLMTLYLVLFLCLLCIFLLVPFLSKVGIRCFAAICTSALALGHRIGRSSEQNQYVTWLQNCHWRSNVAFLHFSL